MVCRRCSLVRHVTVFPYRCVCGKTHSAPAEIPPASIPTPEELAAWPFVWTYWAGGAVADELRYSIRSVLHHHPAANVIVIGDKPKWYRGEFIACSRIPKSGNFRSFRDCYHKLLTAASQIPQFVWMMDDVYWLRAFGIADEAAAPKFIRNLTAEQASIWRPKNAWGKTRKRAYEWLIANGHPLRDFAAHLPQPIFADSFLAMESDLGLIRDYKNWECIYFNVYHAGDAQDWSRRYLRVTRTEQNILTPHRVLNHTHSKYRGAVERHLRSTFHRRSIAEIAEPRGVGTILKEMVGCGCRSIDWRQWDSRGVAWCRDHAAEIAAALVAEPRTGLTAERAAEMVGIAIGVAVR